MYIYVHLAQLNTTFTTQSTKYYDCNLALHVYKPLIINLKPQSPYTSSPLTLHGVGILPKVLINGFKSLTVSWKRFSLLPRKPKRSKIHNTNYMPHHYCHLLNSYRTLWHPVYTRLTLYKGQHFQRASLFSLPSHLKLLTPFNAHYANGSRSFGDESSYYTTLKGHLN